MPGPLERAEGGAGSTHRSGGSAGQGASADCTSKCSAETASLYQSLVTVSCLQILAFILLVYILDTDYLLMRAVYGGHWHTDLTFYLGNLVPCLACASPKLPTCPHFPMHQPFRGNAPLSNPADQFYSWPFPHGLFFLSIHWQWHSDTLKTFHCTQLPFPDPTASGSHHLDLSYHLTTESFKVLNTYSANCRQKQKFAKPIIVSWKLAASLKRLLWRKATTLHSGFCIFVHWMNIGLRFGWKIYYFGNSL